MGVPKQHSRTLNVPPAAAALLSVPLDNIVLIRSRGHPVCTGLSTNASCQQEKPENSKEKTWGPASTLGLSLHPRRTPLQTRENRWVAKICGMCRIRARRTAGDAVNKTGDWSWGRNILAPRHRFEPRFTAPAHSASEPKERAASCKVHPD